MLRLCSGVLNPPMLLIGILAVGCGGGGADGGTPPPTTTIAKTSSNSGDAQNGTVGQPLASPLQVLVTENGSPSSGVTVTWTTNTANGSLTPSSGPTDANGIATSGWALGTVSGSQSAQATLTGAAGSPITFTATAAPGAAASLAKAGGDNQSAVVNSQLSAPVEARVADQFGNGVPAVGVDWGVSGGTPSTATVPTDAAGISPLNVTAGATVGPITITATSGVLVGSPLTFTATATATPSGATIQVGNGSGSGATQAVFVPSSVTISVGQTITWVWNSGITAHNVSTSSGSPGVPGTPTQTKATPFTFGPVTFTVAGTYTFYCSVHASPTEPVAPGRMVGQIIVQ